MFIEFAVKKKKDEGKKIEIVLFTENLIQKRHPFTSRRKKKTWLRKKRKHEENLKKKEHLALG